MNTQQTYLIFDGDKVGDILARVYLSNSEEELAVIDQALKAGFLALEGLLREKSMFLIACGADGITCRGVVHDMGLLFSEANRLTNPVSISMGCGKSLREAFLCLRFAKACGRARWAIMGNDGQITVTTLKDAYEQKDDK